MEREQLTKAEIERLCVDKLRRCATLRDVAAVEIAPLNDNTSWTWDVTAVRGTEIGIVQWREFGLEAIRELQQKYDLA